MNTKVLTVIVPAYNMQDYLEKCLDSLVIEMPLMDKVEVVVVNDGSRDGTSSIAHSYAERYPDSFRVVDKPNGNYGSCINVALAQAKGTYVRVLDADDFVDSRNFAKYVERAAEEAGKGPDCVDLIVTQYESVNPEGVRLSLTDYGLGEERYMALDEVLSTGKRFTIHSVTYRLEILRRISYRQTEGISYTDTEWIIEPMVGVRKLLYLPIVVTRYLVGRGGQTTEDRTFARKFNQVVAIAKNIVSRYERLSDLACESARAYYREQVEGVLRMVYYCTLLGWCGYRASGSFKEFDKYLAPYGELYQAAFSFSIKPQFLSSVYYVRWARSGKISHRLALGVLRLYVMLSAAFKRLCHRG